MSRFLTKNLKSATNKYVMADIQLNVWSKKPIALEQRHASENNNCNLIRKKAVKTSER